MVAISTLSATRSADHGVPLSPVTLPGIIWFLSEVIHTSESSGIGGRVRTL